MIYLDDRIPLRPCGCPINEYHSCTPRMKQLVIGLYGPSGVGKDTIQQTLGWPKASFAGRFKDGMRAFILDYAGLDIEKREDKEAVRPFLEEGAKTLRKIDPNIAVKKIVWPAGPVACVTDVRAFNEMVKVWGMGGVIFDVRREGIVFKDHWQIEEAAKVEQQCRDLGVTLPVIQNTTPAEAADAIRSYLRSRLAAHDAALNA